MRLSGLRFSISLAMLVPIFSVNASENDPFTRRYELIKEMPNFTEKLNKKTNELLKLAVNEFNKSHCKSSKKIAPHVIHAQFSELVYKHTASETGLIMYPNSHSLIYYFSKLGFGPIQTWIRKQVPDKFTIPTNDGIFAGSKPISSTFLDHWKGINVLVNNQYVSDDKFDHFLDQGFSYFYKSDFGKKSKELLDLGHQGELTHFGLYHGVYSYADLRSNWDGYQFYLNLFKKTEHSEAMFIVNNEQCISQQVPFDWGHWVTWEWDEFLNPSQYTEELSKTVKDNIRKRKNHYCPIYKEAHKRNDYQQFKKRGTEYLIPKAPHPKNVFDISDICDEK